MANMTYENWRPKDWDRLNLKGSARQSWPQEEVEEFFELGADLMVFVIIARMKDKGMAPDLFFEEDNNAS